MKGCAIMANWKFTLPNSSELRQAIENEDSDAIYREILKAYEWISQRFDDDYTIDSLMEEVQWDLDCQAFDEESVNSHLEELYNYCDARKVWIEL